MEAFNEIASITCILPKLWLHKLITNVGKLVLKRKLYNKWTCVHKIVVVELALTKMQLSGQILGCRIIIIVSKGGIWWARQKHIMVTPFDGGVISWTSLMSLKYHYAHGNVFCLFTLLLVIKYCISVFIFLLYTSTCVSYASFFGSKLFSNHFFWIVSLNEFFLL
jgi:hypothetical protein